jgi:hypothetical protein
MFVAVSVFAVTGCGVPIDARMSSIATGVEVHHFNDEGTVLLAMVKGGKAKMPRSRFM